MTDTVEHVAETSAAQEVARAVADMKEYHDFYMNRLYMIVNSAGARGASDIHILPDDGIWTLTQGRLIKDSAPEAVISQEEILEWMRQPGQYGAADDHLLEPTGHISLAFDSGTYRVRGSFRRSTAGISVTFRVIPREIPNADDVGVPQQIQELIRRGAGLILFEGPTGSGKTTAIAALVNKINHELDQHVYLIEDPIEFVHTPFNNSVFTQREIGVHASDFPSAIENAMRSKPNVIVIGELLNPATAKAALYAATTGHLVITAAHAGSVTEALDSFIGQFTADEQPQIRSRLSQSLLAIVVQKLVPAKTGGLTAAREVLINDRNFQEVISSGDTKLLHQQMESSPGSFSLEDSLIELVREGKISADTARESSRKPDTIHDGLARLGVKP